MKLQETVDLMTSDDYKERFQAEYYQLAIRIKGLRSMLSQLKEGTLPFEPTISPRLLNAQLKAMESYEFYLSGRARIEGIDLESLEK